MQSFKLNDKQSDAMMKVVTGKNLFISGPGGVGKSVLVREIMDKFSGSTVFLAPTGIAALNIGGATIHSTFKFPHHMLTKKEFSNIHSKTRDLFDKHGPVKRIVIDEISMVRLDVFKALDVQLRKIRRVNKPFGGIQIIVVGDFFQLPPVVTNDEKKHYSKEYDSNFAFGDETWSETGFNYIELDQIMRQQNAEFIKHLQAIRKKTDGYKAAVDFFNELGLANQKQVLDEDPTFLCTTRKAAWAINEDNYNDLDGEEHTFFAEKKGLFKDEPAPYELNLKFGTKVVLTANTDNFKNGQIAYVVGFPSNDKIEVILEDTEQHLMVERYKWEAREYKVNDSGELSTYPTGSYSQFPMTHGWAVTIHKCQGLSLKYGIVDIGRGAFASGQTYVALSRMRTLEGLALFAPLKYNDVIVDEEINEFYENGCRGISLL